MEKVYVRLDHYIGREHMIQHIDGAMVVSIEINTDERTRGNQARIILSDSSVHKYYYIDGRLSVTDQKSSFILKPEYVEGPLQTKSVNTDSPDKALRDNVRDCKPPVRYIHPELVEGTAYGMLAGELKYEHWNFLRGFAYSDCLDSLERHVLALKRGEDYDEQTTAILRDGYTCPRTGEFRPGFGDKAPKVRHEWLIGCNLNMIYWLRARGKLTEDRGALR